MCNGYYLIYISHHLADQCDHGPGQREMLVKSQARHDNIDNMYIRISRSAHRKGLGSMDHSQVHQSPQRDVLRIAELRYHDGRWLH